MPSLWSNVRTGLTWGLVYALGYSAFALALVLAGGKSVLAGYGVGLGTVLAVYFVGGVLAGLVIGVLLPIGRWLLGAILVGFWAALPVGAVFELGGQHPSSSTEFVRDVLTFALLLGPLCGAGLWFVVRRHGGLS